MGQMTSRALMAILGVCMAALGLVGLSETIHPSKTALGPSSMATRLLGPVILALSLLLLALSRTVPRKAVLRSRSLAMIGLVAMLFPLVLWLAGTILAPADGAIWAPLIAVATFLIGMPGFGMLFGGLRRVFSREEDAPPVRPAPKVKRRR